MTAVPKFNLAAALRPLLQAHNRGVIPEPEFTLFDLSPVRDLPREVEPTAITERGGARPNAARRLKVYPPAVPFNYPNA
jgi:hypothetical protein